VDIPQNNTPISSELIDMRLDKALATISGFSRTKAALAIKESNVQVNGTTITDQDYRLQEDDIVTFDITPAPREVIKASDIPINIVFEDSDIIVIDKQSGLTVHPGAGNHDDTLVNALVNYYGKSLSSIGGEDRPGIVHRLDRDTSGLMVIAKNDNVHTMLSNAIAEREVNRIYTALVWGNISPESGTVHTNIARSYKDRTRMTVVSSPSGKHAITHYKTIRSFGYISMLECRLETGRTHQIRVHLSHIGHSVIGDQIYGNNARKINQYYSGDKKEILQKFTRQALHSSKLEFTHPITKKSLSFTSDLPDDMQKIIYSLYN
jgi:23S rRNA pseudouridine1911/1915/1917 synthase